MKKLKLEWENVKNATGYILKIKNLNTGHVKEIDVKDNLYYDLEINDIAFYEWGVLPYNDKKIGKDSQKRVIKVREEKQLGVVNLITPEDGIVLNIEKSNDLPKPVSLKYPGYGQALIPINRSLEWIINEQDNIDGFYINIAKGGNINNLIINKKDIGYTTNYLFENSEYMTTYSWQIIPYNENGEALNCPWWIYTTKPEFNEDAPKVIIGKKITKETSITLPVTTENFNNITSFKLDILYNTSGKEYLKAIEIIPNENLNGVFNTTINTGIESTLSIEWSGDVKTLTNNDKLFDIIFNKIDNINGTTQVEFLYNNEWHNENGQLNDEPHFLFYENGYVNTEIGENDVPQPVKVISPSNGVLKLKVEKCKLKWMSGGQSANIDGFYLNVKKFDEIIVDKIDKKFTLFHELNLEYDSTYKWQIIPYNENGEALNCPWWAFTTESFSKRNSPIYTIGNIETSDEEFNIPITVKNFEKVQIYEFKIKYNSDVIIATGVEVLNPLNTIDNWNVSVVSEPGVISTSWFVLPQISPEIDHLTLLDNTEILYLKFKKVSSGESEVEFVDDPNNNKISCYTGYYDNGTEIFNDIPSDEYYKSGLVKILN
jgi:hypothetical protein